MTASTEKAPSEIDAYIAGFASEVQEKLQKVRLTIQTAAPKAQEKISYQMPTFWLEGNLVHFAGYKKHIGFYPTPSGIARFEAQLVGYKSSKGAVQFPLDQPIPYELIGEITRFRVEENLAKAAAKKGGKRK
jgi:uncharacterized protein YdhG (YjbR/CyaY superfamily)